MATRRTLAVFIMGGTIDSRNDPYLDGAAVTLKKSLVKRYLESQNIDVDISVRVLCMKDSRGITQEDRNTLLQAIIKTGCTHNLVTHGTYTMHETAAYLFEQKLPGDAIVTMVGSMGTLLGTIDDEGHLIPSDAQFNLGYAIAATFQSGPGVYISMNGNMFRQPEEWWKHDAKGTHWKKDGVVSSS